jgi:hypothetical protein
MDSFFITASDGVETSDPVEVSILIGPIDLYARVDSNNDGTVDESDDFAPEVPGKVVLATVPEDPENGFPAAYDLAEIQISYIAMYNSDVTSLDARFTLLGGEARLCRLRSPPPTALRPGPRGSG